MEIFMREVIIILEEDKYLPSLGRLEQELSGWGARCRICRAGREEWKGGGVLVDRTVFEDRGAFAGWQQERRRPRLWITDSFPWAESLASHSVPLVVFLHEGNRRRDFSMARYGIESLEETEALFLENCYRRFAGIPWEIVETGSCLVRETTVEDVDCFYAIYREPSITRYMEGLYPDVEREKQYMKDYIEKVYGFYQFGIWTVIWKSTGEVIGRAGFSFREGCQVPEMGFLIAPLWQRRGIAGEVCGAILRYGWEVLGFDRVQVLVKPENLPSIGLCEKLGFRREEQVRVGRQWYVRMEITRFSFMRQ
ncbi:MAG: GNAT family N-acetyltransferase [Clostridium sp.]|jgi:RimJ/RimL family protein N-acetyltransferase|nr:GNAT family N-acetyltransferase [Clostridium sp.]